MLADGSVREVEQPHMRGGAREPMPRGEIEAKFRANVAFGDWPEERADALAAAYAGAFDAPDLSGLAAFRE